MRPFSIVDDVGFQNLVFTLEPRYEIPSRAHFSRKVIPSIYNAAKEQLMEVLTSNEGRPAFTADSWSSCAAQSYTTFTIHFLDNSSWDLKSYVIATVEDSCHTADNLKDITLKVLKEWKIPVKTRGWVHVFTTDNARNAVNAVSKANLRGIGCLAHTVNLATQRALDVPAVKTLLARVRAVVSYFHHSAKATTALNKAQLDQEVPLPQHKLIQDVATRWNSTLDMLERYLEQQGAIYSVLAAREHRVLLNQLDRMDEVVIARIVEVLKPMKKITTIISSERNPTCGVILPIKGTIKYNCREVEGDSSLIQAMKAAIWNNFKDR